MANIRYLTPNELQAGLVKIRQSPKDKGILKMIVRRPQADEREILESGELNLAEGLVGDNWRTRGSARTAAGSANPQTQLAIMNSRVIALLAQAQEHWPLAGDQLFIDLDLSAENLPPGSRLAIGSAVIEITAQPHTGCEKFVVRFGAEAMKFVNSPLGRQLRLRGIYAQVVHPGVIRAGDTINKITADLPRRPQSPI